MKKLILAAGLTLMAAPAMAHPGHSFGFVPGLLHPLTGADHLLAMLAVGLWSGFVVPDRVWSGAATFMPGMMLGAALAWFGVALPGIEVMILASVAAFGLLVALSRKAQSATMTNASMAMIAVFAACHGYAHAVEATGTTAIYLTGFLISTASLHLAGIGLARGAARWHAAEVAQKVLGGAVAVSGLYLMVG